MDDALTKLVRLARWRAGYGFYDGKVSHASGRLIRACTHVLTLSPEHQANIIYTRDIGHHSGGWWKNPDYERCMHLSVSYRDKAAFLPHDKHETLKIAQAFWPNHHRLAWVEGPYSQEGKAANVWHYRVLCDPSWRPILPRGEVYSRQDTPADWRSFSEIHGIGAQQVDAPFLLAASE